MDWHCLGHAMWFVEASGLRILFDPLLDPTHHGGVFEMDPAREVNAKALAPDFLVVSHAHPDHFDLPSLRKLAQLDPDTVVFTADAIVEDTARKLGFRTVARLETWSRVELDGVRLASTPSQSEDPEWGVLLESAEGTCWNQIDSYHGTPQEIEETLSVASKVFERDLTQGLSLALVRWQPVLEAHAPLCEPPGFPFDEYAASLARIAATRARAVIPSAAGVRQTAPYGFMNHYVYPVPLLRVLRDLAIRAPEIHAFAPTVGGTYRIRGGEPFFEPGGASAFVQVDSKDPGAIATVFRPFELPAVKDPNPNGVEESWAREVVQRWIAGPLARSLAKNYASMQVNTRLKFVVEVVFPSTTDAYTLLVDSYGATVEKRFDDDYDALNTLAGTLFAEVIEGRRQWGDPLLGGMYRSCLRGYQLTREGLVRARIAPTFLYYALPYLDSVRRSIAWQLEQLERFPD